MLNFFVRRPITTLMFVMFWVVLGLVSFPKMNIERTPSLDFPMVTANFVYPGAAPSEIESQVIKKAEDAISEVAGLKKITSQAFENGGGVVQGVHNTDDSVRSFARCCMGYALERKIPLWFGANDTVSKTYDHRFKDIFNEIYNTEYAKKFEEAGIYFLYTLIDDAVARVVRSDGGILWACKNYDGDVMSDMIASAYGSLGMMSSVLVSPDGKYEFEAAHGTVTRHYYAHLRGEETSTNPVATLWAWTGALKKRGECDGNAALADFASRLEIATLKTIESGFMTGDLVPLFNREGITPVKLNTEQFLQKIAERL